MMSSPIFFWSNHTKSTQVSLEDTAGRLRSGMHLIDFKIGSRSYSNCFTGSQAVIWLMEVSKIWAVMRLNFEVTIQICLKIVEK